MTHKILNKFEFLALYRVLFGLLVIIAIVAQLIHGLQRPDFSIVNFFSFFTIQSNILAAGIFLVVGVAMLMGARKGAPWLGSLRGAATLYMLMTGIIYALLLSGLDASLQLTLPWVNIVLHHIMPAAVLVDWLIATPRQKISYKSALLWLLFPIAYAVYSLVRGLFVEWYPYPFLDPLVGGYGQIVVMSIIIAASAAALTWLLVRMTEVPLKKRLIQW